MDVIVLGGAEVQLYYDGKIKDRAKEYMHINVADRRGGIELARRECVDRERWRLFCRGHLLGRRSWRE